MAYRGPDPRDELRQRILELYLALHRKERQPDVADVKEIVWILRELERLGLLYPSHGPSEGFVSQIAASLGITTNMLWITVILLSVLVGRPFFDFLGSILPFFGGS